MKPTGRLVEQFYRLLRYIHKKRKKAKHIRITL